MTVVRCSSHPQGSSLRDLYAVFCRISASSRRPWTSPRRCASWTRTSPTIMWVNPQIPAALHESWVRLARPPQATFDNELHNSLDHASTYNEAWMTSQAPYWGWELWPIDYEWGCSYCVFDVFVGGAVDQIDEQNMYTTFIPWYLIIDHNLCVTEMLVTWTVCMILWNKRLWIWN